MSKFTMFFIIIAAFFIGVPSAIFGQEMTKKGENKEGVFRAVHLVNLKSVENEAEFVEMLNDFNKVVAEVGYPNIRYNLWKERGDREGQYRYIFESTWPDQATYDKVHENEKYQAVSEKHKTRYEEFVKEDIYSRYVPLN
jgi:quinol monooxygenase YgiN